MVGALPAAFGVTSRASYNSAAWGTVPSQAVREVQILDAVREEQILDVPWLGRSWEGEEDGVRRGADPPPMVQMVL